MMNINLTSFQGGGKVEAGSNNPTGIKPVRLDTHRSTHVTGVMYPARTRMTGRVPLKNACTPNVAKMARTYARKRLPAA